uniref:Uncharacterized protein n=1 Tax=Glossina austeni TaxID=7395 RepID=A0A1A9UNZ4_GLOAU
MFLAYVYYHVALVAAVATMVLFAGIGLTLVNQSTPIYIAAIVGDLSCRLGLLDGRAGLKLQFDIMDDEPKLQCAKVIFSSAQLRDITSILSLSAALLIGVTFKGSGSGGKTGNGGTYMLCSLITLCK